MGRVRVAGLVALAAVAVLVFLVAPEDGRFGQAPALLLVAVMALIWHLAWSDGGLRRSVPPPSAAPKSASGDAVPTTSPAGLIPSVVLSDDDEDLSLLPDPPVDWPPPGVEVPMVFRSEPVEAQIIDLTDGTGSSPGRTDTISDSDKPGAPAVPVVAGSTGDQHDPWLAFAAAMFRDD